VSAQSKGWVSGKQMLFVARTLGH